MKNIKDLFYKWLDKLLPQPYVKVYIKNDGFMDDYPDISVGEIIDDKYIMGEITEVNDDENWFKLKILSVKTYYGQVINLQCNKTYKLIRHENSCEKYEVYEVEFYDDAKMLSDQTLLFWFKDGGWSWGR